MKKNDLFFVVAIACMLLCSCSMERKYIGAWSLQYGKYAPDPAYMLLDTDGFAVSIIHNEDGHTYKLIVAGDIEDTGKNTFVLTGREARLVYDNLDIPSKKGGYQGFDGSYVWSIKSSARTYITTECRKTTKKQTVLSLEHDGHTVTFENISEEKIREMF